MWLYGRTLAYYSLPIAIDPFSHWSLLYPGGAKCSSIVPYSLIVQWMIGFISHRLSYFLFQPVPHDWPCMCYPVCGMVPLKDPLLIIEKSSL